MQIVRIDRLFDMKRTKDTTIIPLVIVWWRRRFVTISNLSKFTLTVDFPITLQLGSTRHFQFWLHKQTTHFGQHNWINFWNLHENLHYEVSLTPLGISLFCRIWMLFTIPLLCELLSLLLWYPAALVLLYWLPERPRGFDLLFAAEPIT